MNYADGLLTLCGLNTLFAYIGAGADLSLISAAIGLMLTLGSSLFFLVLWPFRLAWRKLTGQRSTDVGAESLDETEGVRPGDDCAAEFRRAA